MFFVLYAGTSSRGFAAVVLVVVTFGMVQMAAQVKGSHDFAHNKVNSGRYHLCFSPSISFGLKTLELPAHLHLACVSVRVNSKFPCVCVLDSISIAAFTE